MADLYDEFLKNSLCKEELLQLKEGYKSKKSKGRSLTDNDIIEIIMLVNEIVDINVDKAKEELQYRLQRAKEEFIDEMRKKLEAFAKDMDEYEDSTCY